MASSDANRSEMPPQTRLRARAELESQIAVAEANRARWTGIVTRMKAAGRPCRWEEGMLGVAMQKLDCLRRSRAVLAGGE